MAKKNKISKQEKENLISILKTRFEKNKSRHKGLEWKEVQKKKKGR